MTQKVHRALHHGIATYSLKGAGPCNGKLHFGVGMRDEPAVQSGISHLIEHLLLRMVQPTTVLHGGTTGTDSVEFWASGEPEDVAGFLNAIAAAVSTFAEVSKRDIDREKAVIEAEDPNKYRTVEAGLLCNRFGVADLGIAHVGAAATESLDKAELLSWTRQWLVTENAALTFTGRIPDSLDVKLPSGSVPYRVPVIPLVSTPALIVSQKDGVALSLLVPAPDAALLAEALRHELYSRLRHDGGLVYSVVDFQEAMDNDRVQLDLILDPTSPNIIKAFDAAVAALQDLVRGGFSADALAYARKTRRLVDLDDGRSVPEWHLDQLAVNGLRGRTVQSLEDASARLDALTADGLTAVLAGSMESLMVAVAGYAKPRKKHAEAHGLRLDRFRIWQDTETTGPNGLRAWRGKELQAVLWLTTEHLMKQDRNGTTSIAIADIVMVGDRNCGCICLLDRRGRSTEFDVTEWQKGKALRRALLAAFPEEIVRAFPED